MGRNYKADRIGMVNYNKKGEKMIILDYRSAVDLDIIFEDGTILKNRAYKEFNNGSVRKDNLALTRLGKTNINNQGFKMKIIEYRKVDDIDVEFEDGTIITNKKFAHFEDKSMRKPEPDHTGETNFNNYGDKMTILEFNNHMNVLVGFEDGTTTVRRYSCFKSGNIRHPLMNKMRIGEVNLNSQGCKMEIIKYNSHEEILIEFDDLIKTKRIVSYSQFKNGQIKSNFHPSVYGVGYIGDFEKVLPNGVYPTDTKAYDMWVRMLERSCSKNYTEKHPTYKDVSLCEEWKCFTTFYSWFEDNYYELPNTRMELDKDIIIKGNKLYSPETCVVVTQDINCLFTKRQNHRGDYPIGVSYNSREDKYSASCSNPFGNGRQDFLGNHNTIDKAFKTYKKHKEMIIKQVADYYKGRIPNKLYEALYRYKVEITD